MIQNANWNYSDVCSPFWRAYFNLDSGATVWSCGKKWGLVPGTVLILPEGLHYDCLPPKKARHLWIHFSLGSTPAPQEPWSIRLDAVSMKIWRRLYQDTSTHKDLHHLRCDCAAALLQLLGRMSNGAQPALSPQLMQFLSWLDTTLASPPLLDAMAQQAGMGRRSFIRWFGQATGSTPVAYLTSRRIREACRLLCFGNDSIEHIAEATGYSNRHHFSRSFKAETGTSPAAFRRGRLRPSDLPLGLK